MGIKTLQILASVAIIFSWTTPAHAQGWMTLNTGLSRSDIRKISCPTENVCYAAHGSGRIIKTSDGGGTWSPQNFDSAAIGVLSVFFTNQDTGYAVGTSQGMVLKTVDGGMNWLPQRVDTYPWRNLLAAYFVSSQIGYVVGDSGMVYKTSDGGVTWQNQSYPRVSRLVSVQFPTQDTGFIVGYTYGGNFITSYFVLRTTNGGNRWDSVSSINYSSAEVIGLTSCHFLSGKIGYVAGGEGGWGLIYKTIDGGETWIKIYLILNASVGFYDIHFQSPDTGYVAAATQATGGPILGAILKTIDGGITWSLQTDSSVNTQGFTSISFPTPSVGYVAGGNGVILKTRPGVSIIPRPRRGRGFGFSRDGDFRYTLNAPVKVKILLYDLRGRQALKLVDEEQRGGEHKVSAPSYSQPYILDYQGGLQRKAVMGR